MDTLQSRFERSIFARLGNPQWWNPALSWHNKWKGGLPVNGDAFPLSSTTLVGLTDAWHCFKSVMLACFFLAILAPFTQLVRWPWYRWLVVYLLVTFCYGAVFEVFYRGLSR